MPRPPSGKHGSENVTGRHYTRAGFGRGCRNNSSGDTWFEAVSNGNFNGWRQIGSSNTNHFAVGVADFY
jgi:hypothetical protein